METQGASKRIITDAVSAQVRLQIRYLIITFIIALVLSGVTAFPIHSQLTIANDWIRARQFDNALTQWIQFVYRGVDETYSKYPFMAYGTDWLAFAHLVIAVAFIGPLRDPVKNIWVIEFGLIACIAIFPLAFIAGSIRGIPFCWRLIDCSFGLIGGALLWICYNKIKSIC
jgi:hypothetical protein